jgi:hypothetical protein
MTATKLIELAVAVLFLAAGVWLYRRKPAGAEGDGGYGSQGAVLLLIVGTIAAIHALGLLEYRPSQSELEYLKARAQ